MSDNNNPDNDLERSKSDDRSPVKHLVLNKEKPAIKPARLEKPAHGRGMLKRGGTIGPGRPPQVVRESFVAVAADGAQYLKDVLDGKVADATAADKIRAVDVAARYGLGTRTELAGDPENPIMQLVIRKEVKASDGG